MTVAQNQKRHTFHTDPGHGWLEVSIEDVKGFGIEGDISEYSYIDPVRRVCYLEEDCDAAVFSTAMMKLGIDIKVDHQHTDNEHWIRRLPSFSPSFLR